MIGAIIRQRSNSEHFDPAQNDADDSRSGGIRQHRHPKKLRQKSQRKSSRALRKREGCVIISNRVRFLNGIACQARQQRSCEHI